MPNTKQITSFRILFLVFSLMVLTACSGNNNEIINHNENQSNHNMNMNANHNNHEENNGEHQHSEESSEMDMSRSANNGATIQFLFPLADQTFEAGEEIVITIEATNFELAANEGHWHLYIDGVSEGMVTNGITSVTLPVLSPGSHMISAFLTQFTHVELEDGAMVTIIINP